MFSPTNAIRAYDWQGLLNSRHPERVDIIIATIRIAHPEYPG
jgi:hypothetical protein